jgi:SAM-dependent methyltransferase
MENYYQRPAVAFVRGSLSGEHQAYLQPASWVSKPFEELNPADHRQAIDYGLEMGLPMSRFLRNEGFPLYERVIATLKGIRPDNLLDIYPRYGTFLWPLVHHFPFLTTSLTESCATHAETIRAIYKGGLNHIKVWQGTAENMPHFPTQQFDVITALHCLEFCQDPEAVLEEIYRLARRFIMVAIARGGLSINTRQKHSFTEDAMRNFFSDKEMFNLKTETVDNYILFIARK